jgi:hypothetical protein
VDFLDPLEVPAAEDLMAHREAQVLIQVAQVAVLVVEVVDLLVVRLQEPVVMAQFN